MGAEIAKWVSNMVGIPDVPKYIPMKLADMVKGLSDANAVTLRRLLEARALLALASARGPPSARPALVPGAA